MMENSQLEEMTASLKSIVQRAYELGQNDALQKVMDAVTNKPEPEPLAIAGPDANFNASAAYPSKPPVPWWIRPFK